MAKLIDDAKNDETLGVKDAKIYYESLPKKNPWVIVIKKYKKIVLKRVAHRKDIYKLFPTH